jgi:RNA polymerase sigma factor (sigma-70 family)
VAKVRVDRDGEDLIRLYLNDIGRYPLLTRDDEVRLARAIEAGADARTELGEAAALTPAAARELRHVDRVARDAEQTLVQSNLRLVVSIAKKQRSSGLPLLDLIQEGNLGLMHAVEKFDWRKGFKFSTYATWWIRQAVTRGIANTGRTIRIPLHVRDRLANVRIARWELEIQLGRDPTVGEIAAEVGLSEQKVADVLTLPIDPLSLSTPLGEGGDAELGDLIEDQSVRSPFDAAAGALMPGAIDRLLEPLDDRERRILALRFGLDDSEPCTLDEIGRRLNLTRERIRQIELRAITKLRDRASIEVRELLVV